MSSNPCIYMYYRGRDYLKRQQTRATYGCMAVGQSPWARVGLRPWLSPGPCLTLPSVLVCSGSDSSIGFASSGGVSSMSFGPVWTVRGGDDRENAGGTSRCCQRGCRPVAMLLMLPCCAVKRTLHSKNWFHFFWTRVIRKCAMNAVSSDRM